MNAERIINYMDKHQDWFIKKDKLELLKSDDQIYEKDKWELLNSDDQIYTQFKYKGTKNEKNEPHTNGEDAVAIYEDYDLGSKIYIGPFKDGKKHGKGILFEEQDPYYIIKNKEKELYDYQYLKKDAIYGDMIKFLLIARFMHGFFMNPCL